MSTSTNLKEYFFRCKNGLKIIAVYPKERCEKNCPDREYIIEGIFHFRSTPTSH